MIFLSKLVPIGTAYAMAGGEQGGAEGGASPLTSLFPLLAMVAIIYFLLIRPQTKRTKQQRQMLGDLKNGDAVVTKGGMFGKIMSINGNILTIEIANNVRVKVAKDAIGGLASAEGGANPEPGKGN